MVKLGKAKINTNNGRMEDEGTRLVKKIYGETEKEIKK
jgi:hypothetical protein